MQQVSPPTKQSCQHLLKLTKNNKADFFKWNTVSILSVGVWLEGT